MSTELLRVHDVARLLGISKCMVYKLARLGKIQSVRINSAIRFREEDIANYIVSNLSRGMGSEIPQSINQKNN